MEKNLPQYAIVEQTFGAEPPTMHCPVCGMPTRESPDEGFDPCEHVLFIYSGSGGDFDYQSEDFSNRLDESDTDDLFSALSLDTFRDFLSNLGYDNKILAIEITYGGMACGPVWYTDVYGFSFALPKDE